MSARGWTTAVAAVAVLWGCSACGGGSSSTRVTLPKPPPTSRGTRSTDGTHGLVGTCHLMSPQAFRTLVDRSRTVPCSRPHNVETAGVHPVYSTLTKGNTKATVQGYAGGCGPDYNSYLRIDNDAFIRLWGTPIATRRSDGSWVVRCDVYVGTAAGYGSRPAVTQTSLRVQAKTGDTGGWDICTDQPPGPRAPLVDCSRPHRYEGVPTYQAQVAVNRRYPTPAQLHARGLAVCRKAVGHRPDASGLVVTGTWTTKGQWVQQARPTNIYGSCMFSRADHGDLPPVR